MQDLKRKFHSDEVLPFLSLHQTLTALDCSRSFLYSLIDKGALKPRHIGRKPYFLASEILDLLDEKKS